ncbi:hypothetical protein B0T14DRAFT_146694 [Immersiella caudata]|uniref:Uncharacterized protein n=1 Tax=Immersiella caudata TaxID=314043 RepID=A0AA39X708_9PEZI|nr:hypothetical protein B0T14DRAFT_146694 [Immersiella caudata]
MAESIPQLGEIIRFAELAWRIYEIGWSGDFDADLEYIGFGQDVRHLATSLRQLENVINHARSQFTNFGEAPVTLGWDPVSLAEIIGDYSATLRDCERLLRENESYNVTTGAGRNLRWSVFVQPRVDSLRQRILLHNSIIGHVLQPFRIDLTLRIHNSLSRRLDAIQISMNHIHDDIQTIRANLQALMHAFDPALLPVPEGPDEDQIYGVHIPEAIEAGLENLYWSHPRHPNANFLAPPLRDIADAFVCCLEGSTKRFQPDDLNREPPEDQYLNLLACQFLMTKMLESEEYHNSSQLSHWPSYIRDLQRKLSTQCLQLHEEMIIPDISRPDIALPPIWPTEGPPPYIDCVDSSTPMDFLVEMELATEVDGRWQKIALSRGRDSNRLSFRLVITAGDQGQPASQTIAVDFDIREASLVPHYAAPGEDIQPLVLLLNNGRGQTYRLVFRERGELCRFQQALTGYKVVDNYMRHQLRVISVMGDGRKIIEDATVQLWRPMPIDGEQVISEGSSESGYSRGGSTSGRSTSQSNNSDTQLNVFANAQVGHTQMSAGQRRDSSSSTWGAPQTNGYANAQMGHAGATNNTPQSQYSSASARPPPMTPSTVGNMSRSDSRMSNRNDPGTQIAPSPVGKGYTAQRRASSSTSGGSAESPLSPTPRNQAFIDAQLGHSRPSNRHRPNIPNRSSSQSSSSCSSHTQQPPSPSTTIPRRGSYSSGYSPPISPRGPLPPLREDPLDFDEQERTFYPAPNSTSFTSTPPPPPCRPSIAPTTTTNTNTAASILSTASCISKRTVTLSSRATTAPTGTLHTRPTPPLLILFTRRHDPQKNTSTPSIIAITLDPETNVNYRVCNCTSNPNCQVSCIEQNGGPGLKGARIPKMDLLPLAEVRMGERGSLGLRHVIRVSICFGRMGEMEDPERVGEWVAWRREFSGWPCGCTPSTVGELQTCLTLRHKGRLGWVRERHRRDIVEWSEARHDRIRDVVGIGED